MSRALIIVHGNGDRQRLMNLVAKVPTGTRVEFKAAKRSLPQNDLMWSRLSEISRQVVWYGEKLKATDWKDIFTASLRRARVVPGIDPGSTVLLGMTERKPLSRLARVRIFDAHHGTCCICHFKIDAGRGDKWQVEHIKPLWLGGEDDERNMAPAHDHCARDKTSQEAPVKAKSDRVRANHLGIKKPRSIRRWRKFNGTPVYASRER